MKVKMDQEAIDKFHAEVDILKQNHNPQIDDVLKLPIRGQIKIVHYLANRDFKKAADDSGKSISMFIATENVATEMIYEWELYREEVKKEHSVDTPPLVEGVSITIKYCD